MKARWIIALAALVLLAGLPQRTTAQGERRWLADPELLTRRKVIGPDPNPLNQVADVVFDMDLVDARNGWAVAYSGLLRFDGRWWRPAEYIEPRFSLVAIDMASATNGVAVGSSFVSGGPPSVFISRFNGSTWDATYQVIRRNGAKDFLSGRLIDVHVFADGTAVAVGSAYEAAPAGSTLPYVERPLILHFDGTEWRDRTPESWQHGSLLSVSMINANEGWISGQVGTAHDGDVTRPLIARFRDGAWTEQALPPVEHPSITSVYNVVMRDSSEGWAILSETLARCSTTRLLRYTGGQWIDATPANQPLQTITELALIPGTSRGWASLAGCAGPTEGAPTMRMRFDGGMLTPDSGAASLVPRAYALLSDDVQWAAAGGAMMRYSAESLPTERVADPGNARYFPITGHTLGSVFQDYYRTHGLELGDQGVSDRESLALFGYPVSEPFDEINPDSGQILRVQYFERARFEYHPNNPDPYKVLLGRLSANTLIRLDRTPGFESTPPPAPGPNCDRFAWNETPYALCPPFRDFWRRSGGLPVFGFPLTAPTDELSETDGRTYLTQWFERERMEHHPENRGTPYEILLGLLGTEELRARGYLP